MLLQLLMQLRSSLSLPQCLKVLLEIQIKSLS